MTRYIDANELEKRTVLVNGDEFDGEYVIPYTSFESMPTVDKLPPIQAHWILYEPDRLTCSHCRKSYYSELAKTKVRLREAYSYCPHCGAKMVNDGQLYR